MTHEDLKNDFQTPIPVANYMASLISVNAKTVAEPTPGLGNVKNALIERGFEVIAPEDYFLSDRKARVDAFCMNPPFSTKSANMENAPPEAIKAKGMQIGYWFLTEAMKRTDEVVALMPWFTISDSDVRLRMIKRFGLKSITALPRKTFDFARIQTCIIHLEKGYSGSSIFHAFDCMEDHKQHKIGI